MYGIISISHSNKSYCIFSYLNHIHEGFIVNLIQMTDQSIVRYCHLAKIFLKAILILHFYSYVVPLSYWVYYQSIRDFHFVSRAPWINSSEMSKEIEYIAPFHRWYSSGILVNGEGFSFPWLANTSILKTAAHPKARG